MAPVTKKCFNKPFAVRVFAVSYLLRWISFATQAYMVSVGQSLWPHM